MHEFSLLKDLLRKIESVAEDNRSNRVVAVEVWLGALSHISSEHFREHFEHAVKGTIIENARLNVKESDDTKDPQAQEIILKSIEVAK